MLRIQVEKSVVLAAALLLVHALAAGCIVLTLPAGAAFAGTAAIITSAVYRLRLDALQYSADAVVELLLREGGRCELITRAGATLAGQVQGSTFVSPWLIVVNFRLEPNRRRRSLVLVWDSASAEELRELRVWLKYRCVEKAPESSLL